MSAITIPEGFFPPPGVPFSTNKQIDMATTLASFDLVKLEVYMGENKWSPWTGIGSGIPKYYRLAPPKPRTVGPFESNGKFGDDSAKAYKEACDAASGAGFKYFRVKLTATAEEIL